MATSKDEQVLKNLDILEQQLENLRRKRWERGEKCEIYSMLKECWIRGEVIDTFTDKQGEWVKVRYGRTEQELPPDDEHIRKTAFQLKWENVAKALEQELYPQIGSSLGLSVHDLVATGTLNEDDLSHTATVKVIEMMKNKKVLYNKEIEYIKDLVKRANAFQWDETENNEHDLKDIDRFIDNIMTKLMTKTKSTKEPSPMTENEDDDDEDDSSDDDDDEEDHDEDDDDDEYDDDDDDESDDDEDDDDESDQYEYDDDEDDGDDDNEDDVDHDDSDDDEDEDHDNDHEDDDDDQDDDDDDDEDEEDDDEDEDDDDDDDYDDDDHGDVDDDSESDDDDNDDDTDSDDDDTNESTSSESQNSQNEDTKTKDKGLMLLSDVYGVHKALMFGQFKFSKYSKGNFIQNMYDSTNGTVDKSVFSKIFKENESAFNISFHPYYVINDDMFEVMAFHFAVSSFVNRLDRKNGNYNELNIRSIVIPTAITSIYDSEIDHKSSIKDIPHFLNSISSSNPYAGHHIESNLNDVESMSNVLRGMYQRIASDDPKNIIIVLNRRRGRNTVRLFECSDHTELSELNRNYFSGFELNVRWKPVRGANELDIPHRLVRCWMTFGVDQRLRFYPEMLLWIVPRLFARNAMLSASEMVQRLYSAEYKWGWRVNLDDLEFNRIYHRITGYEHITNNYNRNESMLSIKDDDECGLRDHLNHKLHSNLIGKLRQFVDEHAFDSEAILEDSLEEKREDDQKNSSIFGFMKESGLDRHFRAFRHTLLRHRGTVCCKETVLPIEQCPWIEDLVTDLRRLRECGMDIDATNIWDFELDSIMPSWSHVFSVHKVVSDDDVHKENRQKIMQYILQRVQCDGGSNCRALREQRRRRQKNRRFHRIEVEPDPVSGECEAVEETLFGIHCQIFHGQSELIRRAQSDDDSDDDQFFMVDDKDDDDSKQKSDAAKGPGAIDFGRSVLRWLKHDDEPRFDTLKDELILNPRSEIGLAFYDRLQRLSATLSQDSDSTVKEILGLKAYSDTKKFQAALSKAHWDTASQDDRRSFYQWAMTLYRVHLRSARPIEEDPSSASGSEPRALYTGFSLLLSLGQELGAYYGPLSTSKSMDIAKRFSEGKGSIYTYGSSYDNPLKCAVGIDMELISCFTEQEVMLYHSVVPIKNTMTQSKVASILVDHLLYSLMTRAAPIVNKGAFYKKLGIKWKVLWIPFILSHKLLFKPTKCQTMTIKDRLIKELRLKIFEIAIPAREALFVDDDCQVKLRKTSKNSDFENITQFVFGFKFKNEKQTTTGIRYYYPENASSFKFSCRSIMNLISSSLRLAVFCRAKDQLFGKQKATKKRKKKKKNVGFGMIQDLILPEYHLNRKQPLTISESVTVQPFNADLNVGGGLLINSSSKIVIVEDCTIITDSIMDQGDGDHNDSDHDNDRNSDDGDDSKVIDENDIKGDGDRDIEDGDDSKIGDDRPSGDGNDREPDHIDSDDGGDSDNAESEGDDLVSQIGIKLISEDSIINKGVLRCQLEDGQQRGGRVIHLIAPSVINHGEIRCDSEIDEIRIICRHFVNTGTISPEPKVMTGIDVFGDSLLAAEYFLYSLHSRDIPITDKDAFYRNIGVKWRSEWVPFILSHNLMLQPTEYERKSMMERLAMELEISAFKMLYLVEEGAMYVTDDCKLRLKTNTKKPSKTSVEKHCQLLFGMELENGKRYTIQPKNQWKFMLRCRNMMNAISDSLKMNIFCRVNDGKHLINWPIKSLFLNQYHSKRPAPLRISEAIDVRSFDPRFGVGGSMIIKSSSNISISYEGSITTDALRPKGPDMESRVGIALISETLIINQGVLCCKSLSQQRRGARSICLVAPAVINHGVIRCDSKFDEVIIICNDFENTGNITVKKREDQRVHVQRMNKEQITWILEVLIKRSGAVMDLMHFLTRKSREKVIALEYHSHKGHAPDRRGNNHPMNLLEDGRRKWYCSASLIASAEKEEEQEVRDWMIFGMQNEERVFPTKIGIRNRDNSMGVKSVCIFGSANNKRFRKWIVIDDIHNKSKDLQIFDIGDKNGWIACSRKYKFFRIEVVENHWSTIYNSFYEFKIYGIEME